MDVLAGGYFFAVLCNGGEDAASTRIVNLQLVDHRFQQPRKICERNVRIIPRSQVDRGYFENDLVFVESSQIRPFASTLFMKAKIMQILHDIN